MANYLHPGIYLEEIPSGSSPITGVESSTALFIGITVKGPLESTLITKLEDYQTLFGGIQDTGKASIGDAMGHSVTAFFQNGGGKAYIARLDNGGKIATKTWKLSDSSGFAFNAANQGAWGNAICVHIKPKYTEDELKNVDKQLYLVEVGYSTDGTDDTFDLIEQYRDVSLDARDPLYLLNQINGYSGLITVEAVTFAATTTSTETVSAETTDVDYFSLSGDDSKNYFCLSDGLDGKALTSGSDPAEEKKRGYDEIFSEFLKRRDKNIIHLPGQYWSKDGSGNNIIDKGIAHCETMKNCMILVDIDPSLEFTSEKSVTDIKLPTKTYSATYYPWLKVSNPFYNAETNPGVPTTVLVPPSGFAAGMWAKTDGKRGIWKAPAGIETGLLGVAGLAYDVQDTDQDFLNPLGINAVRALPGYGSVLWGTRTLATKASPEWRYISVRRTAMYIEDSLYSNIQWAVFEQNNSVLWSSLRANIGAFMNNLFRAGAFQGDVASDAYFVRCGLGDTMTQYDIDAGQVIAQVAFAPLKPAEFVVLRIQQKINQQ